MHHRPRHLLAISCLTIILITVGAIVSLAPQASALAAPLAQEEPAVLVGAGDISECYNENDTYTAYLMDSIEGTVVAMGDTVYEVGSLKEYNECYDPTWGRHKDRTRPVPGNHEYGTQGAEGYFTYFGDAATPLEPGCTRDCKGYYSYDLGEWHIVALNSEIPNQAGSEQEQWLRADLDANRTACTLAYYHRPTFSSGRHKSGAAIDLYRALYDYGADVVLVGHDHNYERFAPQSPSGEYEPDRGIRQFVVGTGGTNTRDFKFIQPNSEVRDHETWGVIKMTLHSDSYDWEFIPMPGQTFTDSGSSPCVSNPDLPPPPEPIVTETVAAPATNAVVQVTNVVNTTPATTPVTTVATTPSTGASTGTATAGTSASVSGGQYILQPGDTLFAVAIRYGVDWTELATTNNLTEDSILQIGQELTIPGAGGPSSGNTASTSTGTTSTATASTADSSATSSSAAGSSATGTSTAGSSTASSSPQSSGDTVTVASGDTIISIALANDVDWQELLEVNGLEDDTILQIGQKLALP